MSARLDMPRNLALFDLAVRSDRRFERRYGARFSSGAGRLRPNPVTPTQRCAQSAAVSSTPSLTSALTDVPRRRRRGASCVYCSMRGPPVPRDLEGRWSDKALRSAAWSGEVGGPHRTTPVHPGRVWAQLLSAGRYGTSADQTIETRSNPGLGRVGRAAAARVAHDDARATCPRMRRCSARMGDAEWGAFRITRWVRHVDRGSRSPTPPFQVGLKASRQDCGLARPLDRSRLERARLVAAGRVRIGRILPLGHRGSSVSHCRLTSPVPSQTFTGTVALRPAGAAVFVPPAAQRRDCRVRDQPDTDRWLEYKVTPDEV